MEYEYETLNDSSFNENSIGSPTTASSPVHKQKPPRNYTANKRNDAPLRVLVINCQSIKNKKYDMEYLTESTKPDIIIGNESWLNKDNRQRCFHLVIFFTETIVKLMHMVGFLY